MLIPLSRKKFEELVPLVATGAQYKYCWGKFPDFLQRILVSIAALASILVVRTVLPIEELRGVSFFVGLFALVYWLWGPVLQASLRNIQYRKFKYAGFLRGEVFDIYVTDAVIATQENVNDRGDLVVTENRQRQLNLVVGDESGFTTELQVPLIREHRAIRRGDMAEMLVLSSRPDLGRIAQVMDIFITRCEIWVSDYPYLRRDEFEAVSRQLAADGRYDAGYDDRAMSDRMAADSEEDFIEERRSAQSRSGNDSEAQRSAMGRTRAEVLRSRSGRDEFDDDEFDDDLEEDDFGDDLPTNPRRPRLTSAYLEESASENRSSRKRIPKTGAVRRQRFDR